MNKTRLYSIKQAAENLGVSAKTLKNWERNGEISRAKRNRLFWRVYTEEDLKKIRKVKKLGVIMMPEKT